MLRHANQTTWIKGDLRLVGKTHPKTPGSFIKDDPRFKDSVRNQNISLAKKGKKIKPFTEERKRNISAGRKKAHLRDGHIEISVKCSFCDKELLRSLNRIRAMNLKEFFCDRQCRTLYLRAFSMEQKREWAIKMMKLAFKRPTRPEKKMIDIIKRNNLEYEYVGNGKVWLNGVNPDFININGKKIVIEVWGDYIHGRPEEIKKDEKRLNKLNREEPCQPQFVTYQNNYR